MADTEKNNSVAITLKAGDIVTINSTTVVDPETNKATPKMAINIGRKEGNAPGVILADPDDTVQFKGAGKNTAINVMGDLAPRIELDTAGVTVNGSFTLAKESSQQAKVRATPVEVFNIQTEGTKASTRANDPLTEDDAGNRHFTITRSNGTEQNIVIEKGSRGVQVAHQHKSGETLLAIPGVGDFKNTDKAFEQGQGKFLKAAESALAEEKDPKKNAAKQKERGMLGISDAPTGKEAAPKDINDEQKAAAALHASRRIEQLKESIIGKKELGAARFDALNKAVKDVRTDGVTPEEVKALKKALDGVNVGDTAKLDPKTGQLSFPEGSKISNQLKDIRDQFNSAITGNDPTPKSSPLAPGKFGRKSSPYDRQGEDMGTAPPELRGPGGKPFGGQDIPNRPPIPPGGGRSGGPSR